MQICDGIFTILLKSSRCIPHSVPIKNVMLLYESLCESDFHCYHAARCVRHSMSRSLRRQVDRCIICCRCCCCAASSCTGSMLSWSAYCMRFYENENWLCKECLLYQLTLRVACLRPNCRLYWRVLHKFIRLFHLIHRCSVTMIQYVQNITSQNEPLCGLTRPPISRTAITRGSSVSNISCQSSGS